MSQEGPSRDEFKNIALFFLGIGLFFLIIFYITMINIIGDTLLNISKNSPLFIVVLFSFITAAIFGIGYFIKDDYDRDVYELLAYLLWFIMIILGALLDIINISKSIQVGIILLIYISPPFVFMLYKGLKILINPKGS